MKLSRVAVRLGLGLVVAWGGGCAKRVEVEPEVAAPASVAEYYPLAVGNRWSYRINSRVDKQVDVVVEGEEDGYFRDNQGGELTVDAYGIRDKKRYLLRAPLEEGKGWTNVVSVSSTERYRILGVGLPCEAPAGSFRGCVRVEARNRVDARNTLVNTLTFAPGVGLVRIETSVDVGDKLLPQTWLELVSYQVKPAGQMKPSGN